MTITYVKGTKLSYSISGPWSYSISGPSGMWYYQLFVYFEERVLYAGSFTPEEARARLHGLVTEKETYLASLGETAWRDRPRAAYAGLADIAGRADV